MKTVADYTCTTPGFPEPGVMLWDITIIPQDMEGLHLAVDGLREALQGVNYGLIVGPKSHSFIFGVPLTYAKHKPFIPVRKQEGLSVETILEMYEPEYRHATIETRKDTIKPGQRVVIVGDLIVTGGTTEAMARLTEELGDEVVKMLFVTGLKGLHSRERLRGYPVFSLVSYEEEWEQALSISGSAFYKEKSKRVMRR